jgi:DNA-binding phage protein
VALLKSLAEEGNMEGISKVLSRLGFQLPEEPRRNVEDEGWGGLVQEELENGTFEEELMNALEDGDRERVQWLLNSPEDAKEMGVDEKIIKWAFGEEDEEE